MNIILYVAAAVAIISTVMVITRKNVVHALLYMITSLLALAVMFFLFGAPFIAALEVIVYAGAIMVLFIFVVMMLNLGEESAKKEKEWLKPKAWIGPTILTVILFIEFIIMMTGDTMNVINMKPVTPKAVGTALYSEYILGVEIVAMLLMSATIGAYHIGKNKQKEYHRFLKNDEQEN